MPPKPEIVLPLKLQQIASKFQSQVRDFRPWRARIKCRQVIATTTDNQPEMAIWTFCSPILQFLVVDHCRNHLANLLSSSTSSKIPKLALEFRCYLSKFQRCDYFRLWGPCRYLRLSFAVVLNCQHYFLPTHVLYPRFIVGILTVAFIVSEI